MHGVFLGSVESFVRARIENPSVLIVNIVKSKSLVRALSLNVAGLLALVASALAASLGGAVS